MASTAERCTAGVGEQPRGTARWAHGERVRVVHDKRGVLVSGVGEQLRGERAAPQRARRRRPWCADERKKKGEGNFIQGADFVTKIANLSNNLSLTRKLANRNTTSRYPLKKLRCRPRKNQTVFVQITGPVVSEFPRKVLRC
jgi:hypothetical protein